MSLSLTSIVHGFDAAAFERGRIPLCLLHDDAAPSVRGSNSSERATDERLSQQTQNLRGGARRGAASLRLGMGIKPSRCASFLAALRARRIAPESLIDIVVANEYLQNVSDLPPALDTPSSC